MTDPPPQLYAKHLLPYRYGYPLWTPEPSHELLMRRRDGLRIGDVGVIDLENGSFDVFFNICLPREHPLHRATGVPENFVPVQLDDWDIASYPHAEYPGRVISSSSVTAKTIEPTGDGTFRPFTYEFNLASSEGALLILPKGAESSKLRKRQLFKDIATRNADDWYDFAERHLGRIVAHDSLYLITGLYKTRSWSVAAFHEATGTAESSAQFKASAAEGGNNMSYSWETMRALDWRVGPQIDLDIPNQSVFISGFKIALREGILRKRWVEVKVDSPSAQSQLAKLSNGGAGPRDSGSGNLWSRLLSRNGSSGTKSMKRTTWSAKNQTAASSSTVQTDHASETRCATVDHVPRLPFQSSHPSDVINRYLLSKESSANVAITHDTQWIILLEKGLLKMEDLGNNDRLEKIISENYRLISQEGVVYLQAVWDSSIGLSDIDDATREAWKEDRLDDAEEILSKRIFRHTDSDYCAFASRAVIRARLHHWDAGLRDAETSIDIQPSVVAHVAKGLALFGKDKYEPAVEAFKVALQQCDTHDRDIVLLIKFIVLFEVGYHAESMAGIADLTERCPVEVKSTCSFVQAEMYLRLATLATENEDYSKALQLLTRARSLGPFHGSQVTDLNVINLICGWRFDNLPFTIRRQECEAFRLAGRIDEAVESFRAVKREFGEDVRTRKENAEWITTFTQRCLETLESLGDSAMSSQNYDEAITRYSKAIGMGPITREHFLTKRSKAYIAAYAWDEALKDADEAIDLSPLSGPGHESRHEALHGMGRYDEANQAFDRMVSITMFKRSADTQMQQLRSPHGNPPQLTTQTLSSHTLTLDLPGGAERRRATNSERIAQVQDRNTQDPERGNVRLQAELIVQIAALRDQLDSDMTTSERDRVLQDHLTNILNTLLRSPHDLGVAVSGDDDQGQTTRAMSASLRGHEQASNVIVGGVQGPTLPQQLPGLVATLPQLLHDIHTQRSRRPLVSDDSQDSTPVDNELPQSDSPRETQTSSPRHSSGSGNEPVGLLHTDPTAIVVPLPAHPPIIMDGPGNQDFSADSASASSDTQTRIWRNYSPPPPVRVSPVSAGEDVPRRQRTRGPRIPLRSARGSDDYPRRLGQAPGWYQVTHEPIVPPSTGVNVHVPPPPPGVFTQPPVYPVMPSAPSLAQLQPPLHDTLIEILREQRHAHRASLDQQEELTRQMRSMSEWMMKEMQDRLSELRSMTSNMNAHPPRPVELGSTHAQPHHSVGTAAPGPSPFGQPWSTPWYYSHPPPSYTSYSTPLNPIPYNTTPFSATPHGVNPYGPSPFSTMPFGPTSHVPNPFGTTTFNATPYGTTSHGTNPVGPTPFSGTPYNVTPYVPSEPSLYATPPLPTIPGPEPGHEYRRGASPTIPPPPGSQIHRERAPSPASNSSSVPEVSIEPPTPGWVSNSKSSSSGAQPAPVASTSSEKSLLLRPERESPISVATLVQSPTSMASPLSTLSTRIGVPEHDSPKKSDKFGTGDEVGAKLSKLRKPGQVTFGEVTYISS